MNIIEKRIKNNILLDTNNDTNDDTNNDTNNIEINNNKQYCNLYNIIFRK